MSLLTPEAAGARARKLAKQRDTARERCTELVTELQLLREDLQIARTAAREALKLVRFGSTEAAMAWADAYLPMDRVGWIIDVELQVQVPAGLGATIESMTLTLPPDEDPDDDN